MRTSTTRIFAFVILALLGAPVAMHVVVHDLHDHHQRHAEMSFAALAHGDHEHPIVSSVTPPVAPPTRAVVSSVARPVAGSTAWRRRATSHRNVVSLGALRMDDDVGLQPLLSTFLI